MAAREVPTLLALMLLLLLLGPQLVSGREWGDNIRMSYRIADKRQPGAGGVAMTDTNGRGSSSWTPVTAHQAPRFLAVCPLRRLSCSWDSGDALTFAPPVGGLARRAEAVFKLHGVCRISDAITEPSRLTANGCLRPSCRFRRRMALSTSPQWNSPFPTMETL